MEKQIQNLLARLKEIDGEQSQIEKNADLENDGKFSPEQTAKYDELQAEYEAKNEQKIELERQLALRNARQERVAKKELEAAVLPRRTPANSGTAVVLPGTPVENEQELNEDGTKRVKFKMPSNVRRVKPRNFRGVIDGMGAEERAYRFGMFCLASLSQQVPKFRFPKAEAFVRDHMPTNTAHGETGGTTGGEFLVPEEFSADIIILREQYGVARRLFQRSIMTRDVKHEPKRLSGLTAFFVSEGSAGTESNMTWQDIQLIAKDLMCLSRISNDLSMDAVVDVGDTIAGEMAYAFANKEDDCGFNGTGKSTYAGIQGVINALQNTDGANTASAGLVTGTSTGWAGLVLGDFNKTLGTLPLYATGGNTRWVTHRAFYGSTMQRLETAAGGNTVMTIRDGDTTAEPLFLGFPVTFAQIMPSSTGTNVPVLFGDFSMGAIFGDRQQTTMAFSEHAVIGGQSVFENNQIAIRAVERFDINVHGCGTSSLVGPIVGLLSN